jgi:hypothetical protein
MRSGRLFETQADRAKWGVGDILRLTGLTVRPVVLSHKKIDCPK